MLGSTTILGGESRQDSVEPSPSGPALHPGEPGKEEAAVSGSIQWQEVGACAERRGVEGVEEQGGVSFSKIQGKAPYRRPRVGPDFQALIPDIKEEEKSGSS